MAAPILALDGVGHVAGGARVLDEVSFSLAAGERLAVIGGNGSGKSSLARMAAGLIAPTTGRTALFGTDVALASPDDLRRLRGRIGVVLQGGSLIGDLTVEENLRLGLGAVREASLPRLRGRFDRVLVNFGLEHAAVRQAETLSTGERRRVELARAFLREPELLILDDPFDGADAHTREDLEERLTLALRRWAPALLLLTHDPALAERLACAPLPLDQGRLAA